MERAALLLIAMALHGCVEFGHGAEQCVPEPFPAEVSSVMISRLTTGDPEIVVKFRNRSRRTIDSYIYELRFYDDRGNQLQKFGFGDEVIAVSGSDDIAPRGEAGPYMYEAYGFDRATRVDITLVDVQFENGERLMCSDVCDHDCLHDVGFDE